MQALVVMDEPQRSEVAGELRDSGWSVSVCEDVPTAVATARRHQPEVVVTSNRLPGGGGEMLITRLRGLVATAMTPIVAVSVDVYEGANLLAAGATSSVAASSGPGHIAKAVSAAVGRQSLPPAQAPAMLLTDPVRLTALEQTGLLPGDEDAAFDDITRVAADLLPAPTTLVSLVNGSGQFFPGRTDMSPRERGARESPLSESFCQWAVTSQERLVVEDAAKHELLSRNPAVALGVRAYAGVPLVVEDVTLGTVCAVDYDARAWDGEDLRILEMLGRLATAELRVRMAERERSDDAHQAPLITAIQDGIRATIELLRTTNSTPGSVAFTAVVRLLERFNRRLPRREHA